MPIHVLCGLYSLPHSDPPRQRGGGKDGDLQQGGLARCFKECGTAPAPDE
jgi:hypothetical protein